MNMNADEIRRPCVFAIGPPKGMRKHGIYCGTWVSMAFSGLDLFKHIRGSSWLFMKQSNNDALL